MRIALVIAALALASAQAAAQNSSPPRPVYPMPPPPPVVITTPDGREAPGHIDTTDRTTRCLLYGKSIGVPADQIDDYIKRCVLQ